MLYLSISRKERDLESITANGRSYPVSGYKGVSTYYYDKNGVNDPANGHELALPQPYSNLGITAGVFISFNDPGKANKKGR